MLGGLIVLLLTLPYLHAGSTKKPCMDRLDIPSTQSCCKMPEIILSSFDTKCRHLDMALHNWPCTFECIYKNAKVLNGTHLALDNVYAMLDKLIKDNQRLKDLFVEGFGECQKKEDQMVRKLSTRQFANKAKCSPLAMLYGICAYKHVFLYCPDENWTNSSLCNRIRTCELSRRI